ncbi:MAG: adenosylcobinamide-phosphate synthase [Candidatus Tokpelaia sp. JSC189]|nr:MAG: adenosylcobinamide-phosphate synthase [Candidatus Tokpelaia sp. JSC189]
MIVGPDPQSLDAGGICRAAIESLAENSSDGVIAPAFWYTILGIPGLLSYKMFNTADSIIGHKNKRYAAFVFAAARLDDIANYIPVRMRKAKSPGVLISEGLFGFSGRL